MTAKFRTAAVIAVVALVPLTVADPEGVQDTV